MLFVGLVIGGARSGEVMGDRLVVCRVRERRAGIGPFAVATYVVVSRTGALVRSGFLSRRSAFMWAKGQGLTVLGYQEKE